MTESGSLPGTGMAITAGANTTITGIATATVVIMTVTGITITTSFCSCAK